MGSKGWRNLGLMFLASAALVGCNNGPERIGGLGQSQPFRSQGQVAQNNSPFGQGSSVQQQQPQRLPQQPPGNFSPAGPAGQSFNPMPTGPGGPGGSNPMVRPDVSNPFAPTAPQFPGSGLQPTTGGSQPVPNFGDQRPTAPGSYPPPPTGFRGPGL